MPGHNSDANSPVDFKTYGKGILIILKKNSGLRVTFLWCSKNIEITLTLEFSTNLTILFLQSYRGYLFGYIHFSL